MFDTVLIITFFLLASLLIYLLTLRFMSLFLFITDINEFFQTSPIYFDPLPLFIKVNKNLRPYPVY